VCAPRHCAGDELDQPLPVAAAANEAYKRAKAAGLGDADFAAVYEAVTQRKKA
jgi:3-hydroxyisobutyrate dehydrogenase-like beta-hydroxyacid dehydrogenase